MPKDRGLSTLINVKRANVSDLPPPLRGKPYTVTERRYGANLFGFGRCEIERVVFAWDIKGGTLMPETLLREVEDSRLIWRGFSREARRCRSRTLESGLLPGAQMREVPQDDV